MNVWKEKVLLGFQFFTVHSVIFILVIAKQLKFEVKQTNFGLAGVAQRHLKAIMTVITLFLERSYLSWFDSSND